MSAPLFLVDAFATEPFRGNPAAVCLTATARPAEWMQAVAAELNLSETAFLVARADGYDLRWFSPEVEIDLCGHATLASAHALWTEGIAKPDEPLRFHTRAGMLSASREGDLIALDFPADPAQPMPVPPAVEEALGARVVWYGRSEDDHVCELESEQAVRAVAPDMARVKALGMQGVIVTAAFDGDEADFVSRYFVPSVGVAEDPATGAAHCTLGPLWGGRLGLREVRGYQASARGASIGVRLRGERVDLVGAAVTIARGALL